METLTKFEALLGELEPYTPKSVTIKKALAANECYFRWSNRK